jgi:hypothetical protein
VPVLLRIRGFAFFMVMADCAERAHVHVRAGADQRGDPRAKVWLEPDVELERVRGYDKSDIAKIERLASENQEILLSRWHQICDGAAGP